ncbi:Protein-lysine N-methyltransferase efm4 [Talaromyces marneffei ATCC 18224]|uniref:Protein-lysine N-methyltransferase EFM4 n=1 Tax=Talaromyces marneffei (strain ATCC 18224 / CBS 334.59 / QM 7333) TaxID=441960 RepID=B6QRZ9_TALMQ|nr:S-adenosylmethionine-dependent methyltransferase, putative [Talaromyces marneffei ATCC 18224]
MDTQHPQYLEPSELGTKEYWETYYERSLEHIASKTKTRTKPDITTTTTSSNEEEDENEEGEEEDDDDDPGTSWFSEHDAPQKVLRYLTSRKFPLAPKNLRKQRENKEPSILDLGTGNGSMLALLRKRGGFKGVMVGVDYSEQSVRLARELQRLRLHSAYESGDDSDDYDDDDDDDDDDDEEEEEEEEDEEEEDVVVATSTGDDSVQREEGIPLKNQDIQFEEWDILDPANETILNNNNDTKKLSWFPYETQGFDIVLDKGTFDAISLSDETTGSANTHICHQYPIVASKLVRPGGYLIVTSCNWTEDELVHWLTTESTSTGLEVWHRLEYPRFRFGGMEGQGVCTVCFRRKV